MPSNTPQNHPDTFINACANNGFHIENLIHAWYERFSELERNGDCIDGGAFQGFHTLRMTQCFSGNVYAIEANPESYSALLERIKQWPITLPGTPRPINIALVGMSGLDTIGFYKSERHPGRSTLKPEIWEDLKPGEVDYSSPLEVACKSIDELVNEMQINSLSLIKLDLEGAELEALQGGVSAINSARPPIVMEFGLRKHNELIFNQKLDDFFEFLVTQSYSAYLPWTEEIDTPEKLRFWYVFLIPNEKPHFLKYLKDSWNSSVL